MPKIKYKDEEYSGFGVSTPMTQAEAETGTSEALRVITPKVLHDFVEGRDIYSTTDEIKIGTWVDGKPIYRKVINYGTLPNAAMLRKPHNITNLSSVVKAYGIGFKSDIGWYPLPYPSPQNVANAIEMLVTSTEISILTGSDRSSINAYIIIEYTKTTD